jgi:hypothetical protein
LLLDVRRHGHPLDRLSTMFASCLRRCHHGGRLEVFADVEDQIVRHNAANRSWTMGHNAFSDMTDDEIARYTGPHPLP